jgi:glycosyltransferase involved in cell wall biosynthesis
MRAGKPCIASRVPGSGMTEVVQDQISGLLVQPGSADELAAAIAHLRDNIALRLTLGEAGRQRWEANYRIERSAAAISDCYQTLLDQP